MWVALVDTDIDNGCLRVAPGSHCRGLIDHHRSDHNPALREVDAVALVPLEMKAGEGVAFSGLLLHGSGDNTTDAERVALFARYCHPEVVMVTDGRKPVLEDAHSWMVRGEASDRTVAERQRQVHEPMITSLGHVLPYAASKYGDKTALCIDGREFSFVELDDLSGRLAAGCRSSGWVRATS